ncbi:MAG: HAD family hydrolase [Planctomycetota bacterium]
MIEAVLFDIGDTFVHFETSEARKLLNSCAGPAYQRLLELGFTPPPYERYRKSLVWAFVRAFVWSRLRRREMRVIDVLGARHRSMGMPIDDAGMAEIVSHCVTPLRQFFTADEEAVAVMSQLQREGFKLGIVSNTMFPALAIDHVLEHDGLLHWFPVRIYSSDVGYMKPHRRIFEAALARLGVQAERTAFVGDRVDKDIKGARRVGMTTILMCRGDYTPRGFVRPDHVVRRLSELLPILQGRPAASDCSSHA